MSYLTDLGRLTEWQEQVVSARPLDEGPLKVGSKASLTRRIGKRQQTFTTELTDWSPPRSYAFRGIDGPVRPIGKGALEPIDNGAGTRFTFSIDFEGRGIGKLLVPLVVRKQAKSELAKSHAALKERLESGARQISFGSLARVSTSGAISSSFRVLHFHSLARPVPSGCPF